MEPEDGLSNAPSIAQINGCLQDSDGDSEDFLPEEVQHLTHEGRDVLRKLLTIEPRQRIRSVMALQRIAIYKDYNLSSKQLLSVSYVQFTMPWNSRLSIAICSSRLGRL